MNTKKDKDLKTSNVGSTKRRNIGSENIGSESTRRPSEGYEGTTGSIGNDGVGSSGMDRSEGSDLNEGFEKRDHRNIETDRKSRQ